MTFKTKRAMRALTAGVGTAALLAGSFGVALAASSSSIDTNGDGYVSVAEAAPFYGSIVASLTTTGDTSAASALALDRFPTASSSGTMSYSRTFTVSDELAQEIRSNQAEIVQHGIDLNGDGAYDGTATSSVDASLPLEATIPADCGLLQMTGSSTAVANLTSINAPYSHARGTVQASLNGDELTLDITSTGLSPDLAHAQHIHFGGTHQCPPASIASSTGSGTGTGTGSGTGIGTSSGPFGSGHLNSVFADARARFDALKARFDQIHAELQAIFSSSPFGTGSSIGNGSADGSYGTGHVMMTPTQPTAPTAPVAPTGPTMQ